MKTIKILPALICLWLSVAASDNAVQINSGERKFIGSNIEYFVDSTRSLGIGEVMNKTFIPCATDIPNFGNIPHNVWMRFSVSSESEQAVYLDIMAPLLDDLEVYELKNGVPEKIFTGGFTAPFRQKQVATENWVINLDLIDKTPKTFYLKGHSTYPFQVPVVVSAKEKFLEISQRHYLFWGLYIGVMVFALMYNLFIYLSLRERTYLYYVLYIIGSSLFYLGLQGFNYQFLWPGNGHLNLYLPVIICLTNVVITLFAMRFLNITKEQKGQYNFGRFFIGAYILIAIINLSGKFEAAIGLSQLLSLATCIFYITIGILSFKRKVPTAKYFLIGWSTFLILVMIFLLTINNVITSNFFTTHCIFIGHMTEVLLLSFALADRINWLKLENESKQQEIIHYLEEKEQIQLNANRVLEQKVEERTAELIKNQKQLIESEKMAAVGVLASKMAHEIQNPLNFVNNFSLLSGDLVNTVIDHSDQEERSEAAGMLKENLVKINQHGKQAASIINQLQELIRTGTAHKFLDEDKNKPK